MSDAPLHTLRNLARYHTPSPHKTPSKKRPGRGKTPPAKPAFGDEESDKAEPEVDSAKEKENHDGVAEGDEDDVDNEDDKDNEVDKDSEDDEAGRKRQLHKATLQLVQLQLKQAQQAAITKTVKKPGRIAQNVEKQVTLVVGAATTYATPAEKRVTSPENAAA